MNARSSLALLLATAIQLRTVHAAVVHCLDLVTARTYDSGMDPNSVVAGDFNGDGRQDLVVTNLVANTVSVMIAEGGSTFAPPIPYPVGAAPWSVTAADFNSDGRLDLAVVNLTSSTVSVLLGRGDGTFAADTKTTAATSGRRD